MSEAEKAAWIAARVAEIQAAIDEAYPPTGCGCWKCIEGRGERIWFMVLCAECGNKRCPHAADHNLACTASNDTGQAGSAYEHGSGAASARRFETHLAPGEAVTEAQGGAE